MIRLFFQLINEIGQDYKGRIIGLFFLSIIAGIIEIAGIALIFPLIGLVNNPELVESNRYINRLYDLLGFESPNSMVYLIAIAIGAIFIIKNVYMIWFNHLQLTLVRQWRNDICAKIMSRYLKAPYAYHLKRASNEMINTLNYTVSFVLNSYIFSFILMLSYLVVALMLLGFLILQFMIPSIISGGILIILMIVQAKVLRHHTKEISANINKASALNLMVLTQGIAAVKETKAFMREPYFLDSYDKSNQRVSAYDKKMVFLQQMPSYISEIVLVITIITMSCLILAQAYTPTGGMTSLAILATVAFRMAPMMNRALYSYAQIRASSGAAVKLLDEIKELDQLEVEPFIEKVVPLSFKQQLVFKNVCFDYKKDTPALIDINLTIRKGEFIGIIGPSGAGKTTLVDIMLGLLRPSSGLYTADDIAINSPERLRALRAISGYVSQTPYIFNGSVRENVAFGIPPEDIDDQSVIEVLKMAQIDEFFKTRDGYIEAAIGDNGRSLSGGQRQRLAIARALYHNPEIIVMDEATSALDVETEYEITQVVNKLKGSKTIIAIAHRLSTLKECDRLILMDGGRILDIGTFAELENRHTSFSRLLKLSSIK